MVYMSDRLVNITDLLGIARGQNRKQKKETISLVALKFNSENIEIARKITTEGMSEIQRIDYIENLKQKSLMISLNSQHAIEFCMSVLELSQTPFLSTYKNTMV